MSTASTPPSTLMLEECFAAADDRFLDEWVKFHSPAILVPLMKRWLADDRPWARRQLTAYLNRDLNFSGHEVFVKRVYRHFEAARDHVMLGHFMVAFDRMVRRSRVPRFTWNPVTKSSLRHECLFAKPNRTVVDQTGRSMETGTGKWKRSIPLPDILNKPGNRLFRHKTRNHLRRSVWRYFRWLSYREPQEYIRAIAEALLHYRDTDFLAGENIIDNWSLMHACYFHNSAVEFTEAHTNLAKGKSLSSLEAAPYRPELWKLAEAVEPLMKIVEHAESSLARIWAIELLQRDHLPALQQTTVTTLIPLFRHTDLRVQEFAREVFQQSQTLSTLPISVWLMLCELAGFENLSLICEAMKMHVNATRLDNGQILQLATARSTPVATLGFQMLQQRHTERPLSAPELQTLSRAACESIAGPAAQWALLQLNNDRLYSTETVLEFFDSLSAPIRSAAMDWLERPSSRGYDDPVLWSRITETPFDDVRLRLVQCLHQRTQLPGTESGSLTQVWCSVLLGVHRGGRTKAKAMTQIQSALVAQPTHADTLLPVLAVAVRSLRAPERRSALSALASIMVRQPQLHSAIQLHLPELSWGTLP